MNTLELWEKFIKLYNSSAVVYMSVFVSEEEELYGDDTTITSIPKWEVLNEDTWRELIKIDERFAVIRVLFL